MRPALDGHAGIPQENRLLFSALCGIDDLEVQGLLQSGSRVLAEGLPLVEGEIQHALPPHEEINRMSQVVVSLQPVTQADRLDRVSRNLRSMWSPIEVTLCTLLGFRLPISGFDPTRFHDFLWRSLFAKTLPVDDFARVMRAQFRVLRSPYGAMHACGLLTRRFGFGLFPRLQTQGVDVMIAQTPYPARVNRPTRLIVRYMDAVPMLMPHTIIARTFHQASHFEALKRNVRDGAYFACASEATRQDLLAMFPQAESRAVTIHCMLSHHYFAEEATPDRLHEVLDKRGHAVAGAVKGPSRSSPASFAAFPKFLLMVSTLEPRKNHATLLFAWEQLRLSGHDDLKLVIVGSLGWDFESIVAPMKPWIERGELFLLGNMPAEELRLLYRYAQATVCPSLAEGFDYSGVEAMRCGGVVAASDMAVHREVFANAAEYFSAYSVSDAVATLSKFVGTGSEKLRAELTARGVDVSNRYLPDVIVPKWQALLDQVVS